MRCKYCGKKDVKIKREFNHQKKKWETVAVCSNCGRSFLTEVPSQSTSYFSPFSILIIKAFSLFIFFIFITFYISNSFPKLEGPIVIILGIIMTVILCLIIKYRKQVFKKMILIVSNGIKRIKQKILQNKIHLN